MIATGRSILLNHHSAAAVDSIATCIRMTLTHIVAAPLVYNNIKAEIDGAVSKGLISSPIRDSESRKLPFLRAVILEGLRISPAAPPPVFKKVPKGGYTISGYRVPEGTEIGYNTLGAMRAKRYWGDDPNVFRPERWLDGDSKTYVIMGKALHVSWGFERCSYETRTIIRMQLNKVFVEV